MAISPDAVSAVERLATVRAVIERRGERDTALAELGLDTHEWLALQRRALALFAAADASALELGHRYRIAYETAGGSASASAGLVADAVAPSGPIASPAPAGIPSYLKTPQVEPRIVHAAAPVPDLDQTLPPSPARSSPMPFRAATGAPSPPSTVDRGDGTDLSGQTLAADPAITSDASLPFDQGVAMDLMKVDRYVEMAARLRSTPHDADAIMTSFGLETTEQRAKIHRLWQIRFQANPALRERFEKLVEERMRSTPPTPS